MQSRPGDRRRIRGRSGDRSPQNTRKPTITRSEQGGSCHLHRVPDPAICRGRIGLKLQPARLNRLSNCHTPLFSREPSPARMGRAAAPIPANEKSLLQKRLLGPLRPAPKHRPVPTPPCNWTSPTGRNSRLRRHEGSSLRHPTSSDDGGACGTCHVGLAPT